MRRLLIGGLTALLLAGLVALPAQAATEAVRVAALSRVKAVAASGDHFAALRADGSVWLWDGGGALLKPRLILGTPPVRAMAPGAGQIALLCADGTVWTAGLATSEGGVSRAVPVQGLDSVKAVAMARTGLVALRTDGTVWVAGFGADGLAVGQALPDVAGARSVSASGDGYAVLMGDGSVRGIAIDEQGAHIWGDPHVTQADGIAGGSVALQADGTVVTYSRTVGAGQVTGILDGIAVAAGQSQNLVLRADGTVWR